MRLEFLISLLCAGLLPFTGSCGGNEDPAPLQGASAAAGTPPGMGAAAAAGLAGSGVSGAGGTAGVGAAPTTGTGSSPMVAGTAGTAAGSGGTQDQPPSGGSTSGGSTASGGASEPSGGTTAPETGTGGTPPNDGEVDCNAVSGSGLPINATGWLDRTCNDVGIQGAWYCYTDEIQASSCADQIPPFEASGMCLSGTAVEDDTYESWGGGIGLSLNDPGEGGAKGSYDATANGVVGFRITLEGDSLGQSIRVGFNGFAEESELPSPFVEVGELEPGSPVTAEVMIADALVPESWELENSGEGADPTTIYDLQVQFPGGEVEGEYSFCITSIEPITDGSSSVVTCDVSGLTQAGSTSDRYGEINAGNYMVQNNIWNNANGASQSITAYQGASASSVAFLVSPSINVSSDEPASYPSAVYGWHYGEWHGGYQSARSIASIGSAPSTYEYCAPSSGRYNVSYDIWIHPESSPADPPGGTELMIWVAYRDATPIGTEVDSVELAGANWEVWYGDNAGGWDTLSYRRITNAQSVDFDIMEFVNDGVSRNYYSSSENLIGIQAGFEIWEGTEEFTAQSFTASVN